jgi:hypothetical protein
MTSSPRDSRCRYPATAAGVGSAAEAWLPRLPCSMVTVPSSQCGWLRGFPDLFFGLPGSGHELGAAPPRSSLPAALREIVDIPDTHVPWEQNTRRRCRECAPPTRMPCSHPRASIQLARHWPHGRTGSPAGSAGPQLAGSLDVSGQRVVADADADRRCHDGCLLRRSPGAWPGFVLPELGVRNAGAEELPFCLPPPHIRARRSANRPGGHDRRSTRPAPWRAPPASGRLAVQLAVIIHNGTAFVIGAQDPTGDASRRADRPTAPPSAHSSPTQGFTGQS